MATAKTDTRTVTKTVEVEEKIVKLELSELEAKVLGAMTHLVGGEPGSTYRKVTDRIGSALSSAVGWMNGWEYFTWGRSLYALDLKSNDKNSEN